MPHQFLLYGHGRASVVHPRTVAMPANPVPKPRIFSRFSNVLLLDGLLMIRSAGFGIRKEPSHRSGMISLARSPRKPAIHTWVLYGSRMSGGMRQNSSAASIRGARRRLVPPRTRTNLMGFLSESSHRIAH